MARTLVTRCLKAAPRPGIAVLVLVLLARPACARETLPFYTYYDEVPFAVAADHSLTVWLAAWLTRQSAGRYRFEPKQLPRRRLDAVIARPDWNGVVAWANPRWFDDPQQRRYLWSVPCMQDADLIASRRDKPVDFRDASSLDGLKLGGILGHRYADFDAALRDGRLLREDAANETQNLAKLKQGRVDVIFIQASTLAHFRRSDPGLDRWLYVARKPRALPQRHLFIPPGRPDLLPFLNRSLTRLANDPEWQALEKALTGAPR